MPYTRSAYSTNSVSITSWASPRNFRGITDTMFSNKLGIFNSSEQIHGNSWSKRKQGNRSNLVSLMSWTGPSKLLRNKKKQGFIITLDILISKDSSRNSQENKETMFFIPKPCFLISLGPTKKNTLLKETKFLE